MLVWSRLQYREGSPAVICCGTGRICCSYSKVCGPDNSRNSQWFWMWERTIIFLHGQNKPDLSLRSSTSRYWSCFCYLSGSPDSGAKTTCEWDQRIKMTVASFFSLLAVLLLYACFLFVLLFKCCETDAEGSVSKRCNVMGWACSVFERRLCPRSASGPVGESCKNTLLPVVILHCLTFFHKS